jgi:hypothetical protein
MISKRNMVYVIFVWCCLVPLPAHSKTVSKKNGIPKNEMVIDKKAVDALCGMSKECVMGEIFRDSINGIEWLRSKDFSPSGYAANYSFLYILFRVLNDVNPTSIVEFGMGQTSKLTSQYAAYKNANANLVIVEHDQKWIDIFKRQIPTTENIKIMNLSLEEREYNKSKTLVYSKLNQSVGLQKYDLLIVDGGDWAGQYPRIGVLDLIPQCIKDSFVIIFDDYSNEKIVNTTKEALVKLDANKIKYGTTLYAGIRSQFVIYSQDLNFLKEL